MGQPNLLTNIYSLYLRPAQFLQRATLSLIDVKYYLILLGCLVRSVCVSAQTPAWKSYAIDQHLTVRLPAKPQELNVPQTMAANGSPSKNELQVLASQAFRTEDAVANYVLVSIPLTDTSYFALPAPEREAYLKNRSIPLMVAQMRGELLTQKVSVRDGLDSFTLKLRALTSNGSPGVKYVRVLTVKQRIYQLYFLPKENLGEAGTTQRMQFLDAATYARSK